MEHVKYLVFDDIGNKDTLTFNIFVNSSNQATSIKPHPYSVANKNKPFSIVQTSSSQIKFTILSGASSIDIYDINGRCVQRLKPVDAQVVWNGLNTVGRPVSSGRYFAKIKEGSSSRMAEFSVVK
jgi:flagellar hook assembly protein FlgD